jgi:hypothetical protein
MPGSKSTCNAPLQHGKKKQSGGYAGGVVTLLHINLSQFLTC